MRDLVRLVRDTLLIALTERKTVITPLMVRQVAAEMANDYRRLLLPQHCEALRKARATKEIPPDETVRQLLGNLSLLEYRSERAWGDVHPVVRTLL
jgi:hypothetical protein